MRPSCTRTMIWPVTRTGASVARAVAWADMEAQTQSPISTTLS